MHSVSWAAVPARRCVDVNASLPQKFTDGHQDVLVELDLQRSPASRGSISSLADAAPYDAAARIAAGISDGYWCTISSIVIPSPRQSNTMLTGIRVPFRQA